MARQTYQKSRQEWKNNESGNTPVMAENLNYIEDGIKTNSENMALKEIYDDNAINLGRKPDTQTGTASIAFGNSVTASGMGSQAFGNATTASGMCSHAEGANTTASGPQSHAEGMSTTADGLCSHAEGNGTKASKDFQHVQGKYNVEDTEGKYAHIVGGGTSDNDRKNIYMLDWEGNAEFAGDVKDGKGTSINQLLLMIQDLQSQVQELQSS